MDKRPEVGDYVGYNPEDIDIKVAKVKFVDESSFYIDVINGEKPSAKYEIVDDNGETIEYHFETHINDYNYTNHYRVLNKKLIESKLGQILWV